MIHRSGNHACKEPPFTDGDIVLGGNYMQHTPGTEICKGVENVIVEGGNFVNCVPPDSWVIRGGNWVQISRCTHLMETVPRGMTLCAEDCEHRSATMQDVEITREEARKLKVSAAAFDEAAVKDKDGLDDVRFTQRRYVFADVVTKRGRPDRWPTERAVGEIER